MPYTEANRASPSAAFPHLAAQILGCLSPQVAFWGAGGRAAHLWDFSGRWRASPWQGSLGPCRPFSPPLSAPENKGCRGSETPSQPFFSSSAEVSFMHSFIHHPAIHSLSLSFFTHSFNLSFTHLFIKSTASIDSLWLKMQDQSSNLRCFKIEVRGSLKYQKCKQQKCKYK